MFGESKGNHFIPTGQQERRAFINKSKNMQEVLYGSSEVNKNYFVDCKTCHKIALERFKKDFASAHKEQREILREKLNTTIAKKQYEFMEQKQMHEINNYEEKLRKSMQLSYQQQLWDLGLKKNGMTPGIPVNPINHEYATNYHGKQFQRQQSEKKLNNMLRLHHLQTKSTCGYNPINGKQNSSVKNLIPETLFDGMDSRFKEYQDRYSIRPPGYE